MYLNIILYFMLKDLDKKTKEELINIIKQIDHENTELK